MKYLLFSTRVILILLSVTTGVIQQAHSQNFVAGIQYTIDKQYFVRQSDDLHTPTGESNKAGLILEFTPYYSKFFIASGAHYMMNDLGNSIMVPLTFAETGGYYNPVLEDISEDFSLKNDVGVLSEIGVIFSLSKHWRLEAGYNYILGLTPALEEEILLPLNQVSLEHYRRNERGFAFRAKFTF
jgi:hypothetical protein